MVITNPPAIIRCSCSISSAIWNAALYVPATCTAPTAGRACSSRSSCGIAAGSGASISAFAMPGVYEYLEAEHIKYAIRLPANQVLQNRIAYLLKRPVGRPPNEVRRYYASFSYQAASWSKPRRVIAKVEWHPGELYPRVGFIVTNMSRPAERVVAFYNKRGTCEQWIKEGKGAIKWTRLSCRTFAAKRGAAPASCTRLQPRQFPAHAGDAGADQGLVADDLEGQADQDRREGGEPRPLCYLPDGRGRHRTANVPGDFAADRGTTAAAATSAGVSVR